MGNAVRECSMRLGKYTKHTQEEANRILKLRSMGLTWNVIRQRTGLSESACRAMIKRYVS